MKNLVLALVLMAFPVLSSAMEESTRIYHSADVSGSLNNKYFVAFQPVSEGGDKYVFYFRVAGMTSTPPSVSGILIPVDIQPNETKEWVGWAVQIAAYTYDNEHFNTIGANPVDEDEDGNHEWLMVYAFQHGECTDSYDGNTGWTFETYLQGS